MKKILKFIYLFVLTLSIAKISFADSSTASSSSNALLPVDDPATYRDLQNLSQSIQYPVIATGTAQNLTIINAAITNLNVGGVKQTNSCGYIIGTIVQEVQFVDTAASATVTTSYVPTKTTASITPKCATDKIKISVSSSIQCVPANLADFQGTIFRNSTDLDTTGNGFLVLGNGSATNLFATAATSYTDSPNTTSSTTYTIKMKMLGAGTEVVWNAVGGPTPLILDEIAR